ncbi:MAG: polysaccharide deacetylase family protein [Bacteroidales bacterium]|nr:polysaccharide deacetylase family protein [Bacteroidales bacterium]
MYLSLTPEIVLNLFKNKIVWKINTEEKKIFLTFDDGPVPEITPKVLKILKDFNVKATFFCVGDNVRKYPEVFNQIIESGHAVGNHTFNHLNSWKTPSKLYLENIKKNEEYFSTNLFRPPYGKLRPYIFKKLKEDYKIILWTILSGDFDNKISNLKCLNNVIDNATNGSIIVFHDSIKAQNKLFYALPRVLEHFSKLGFQFCSITNDVLNN